RANEVLKASATAIGKIPNEILSEIFRCYVEMNSPVWTLIKVSTHWRHIALSLPYLWNVLTITDFLNGRGYERFEYCGDIFYCDGRTHACTRPSELRDIVDRCGTLPLDVSIQCYTLHYATILNITSCIDLLSTRSIMERVTCLRIDISSPLLMAMDCFKALPCRNLRHLEIRQELPDMWKNTILDSISNTAVSLQSFSTTTTLESSIFPDHIWLGIKSIHLQPCFPSSNIDLWVHKVSHIEQFSGLPRFWPSKTTPRCTFSNLLKISLRCTPQALHRLHLSALQDLTITDGRDQPLEPNDPVPELSKYVALKSLTVDSFRPNQWLANISTPKLENMKLVIRRCEELN
ncbi:13781_t:CDS:1, partial [Acaulospora colombiana]